MGQFNYVEIPQLVLFSSVYKKLLLNTVKSKRATVFGKLHKYNWAFTAIVAASAPCAPLIYSLRRNLSNYSAFVLMRTRVSFIFFFVISFNSNEAVAQTLLASWVPFHPVSELSVFLWTTIRAHADNKDEIIDWSSPPQPSSNWPRVTEKRKEGSGKAPKKWLGTN